MVSKINIIVFRFKKSFYNVLFLIKENKLIMRNYFDVFAVCIKIVYNKREISIYYIKNNSNKYKKHIGTNKQKKITTYEKSWKYMYKIIRLFNIFS